MLRAHGLLRMRLAGLSVTTLSLLMLVVGCGGGSGSSGQEEEEEGQPSSAQQAPQEAAPSGSGDGRGLVGTWQITHINGNPVPDQYDRMTFSEDGTLTSTSTLLEEVGSDLEVPPVQYTVLDDTRLQITPPEEEGAPYVQEYSLEGDTLTFYTRDPEFPIEQTFKRTS